MVTLKGELPFEILQYLFDRPAQQVAITDFEVHLGKSVYELRPAIEDLKTHGFISEDEYRVEILPMGRAFSQSKWV
jgi:hypothetical protein